MTDPNVLMFTEQALVPVPRSVTLIFTEAEGGGVAVSHSVRMTEHAAKDVLDFIDLMSSEEVER